MEEHILDNLVWHALCHDLAEFAVGTALAKRCGPELVNAAGLANHSEAALDDFADLFNPGEDAGIFEATPPQEIPGFAAGHRESIDQLVCRQRTPVPEHDIEIIELTPSDIPDMIQLVELTRPGPFVPGMVGRRRYVGIRQGGQLVAMGGERFRPPGYCAVSSVCTHPAWRGRGYARLLCAVIADGIWARGETPFLHVLAQNTAAYRVYEQLRFVKRCEMTVQVFTRS